MGSALRIEWCLRMSCFGSWRRSSWGDGRLTRCRLGRCPARTRWVWALAWPGPWSGWTWYRELCPVSAAESIKILGVLMPKFYHQFFCGFICKCMKNYGWVSYKEDVVGKWTRSDFLCVAAKSKFLVEHFLMGILRSWNFHIMTRTRNAKLTRLRGHTISAHAIFRPF